MIWLLSLQKVKLNSIVSVYCCITTSTIVESLMEVNMYSHTFFLPFFLFIKLSQYVMGNWFSNVYFSENISESYKVILWFASFFSLFYSKRNNIRPLCVSFHTSLQLETKPELSFKTHQLVNWFEFAYFWLFETYALWFYPYNSTKNFFEDSSSFLKHFWGDITHHYFLILLTSLCRQISIYLSKWALLASLFKTDSHAFTSLFYRLRSGSICHP